MAALLTVDQALAALADGPRHQLGQLLHVPVPSTPGVYALWHEDELLYIGMARTDPSQVTNRRADGVRGRLRTYLDGRMTDVFVVAAAFRFLVPTLDTRQLTALGASTLTVRDLEKLFTPWMAEHISFSCAATSPADATAAENAARSRGVAGTPPTFNPRTSGR